MRMRLAGDDNAGDDGSLVDAADHDNEHASDDEHGIIGEDTTCTTSRNERSGLHAVRKPSVMANRALVRRLLACGREVAAAAEAAPLAVHGDTHSDPINLFDPLVALEQGAPHGAATVGAHLFARGRDRDTGGNDSGHEI